MSDKSCLFTIIHTGEENKNERVLRELVAPVASELRDCPELDSLFYGCFSYPDPQVRFRVLGQSDWVDASVRDEMAWRVEALEGSGLAQDHEFGQYGREVERYGGELGMRLTERIYHHDSLACLDLIEADARGLLKRSRRELSLVMTERVLDLLQFDADRRVKFYEFASRWPSEEGDWQEEDHATLDRRYESLREGLALLASDAPESDPQALWGGAEPAVIVTRCLDALRPVMGEVREAHSADRIHQDLVYLAWSWTHLHCNRMGIAALPEAILRQMMLRHYRGGTGARPDPGET